MKFLLTLIACSLLISTLLTADDFSFGRQTGLAGGILLSDPTASEKLTCPTAHFTENNISLETGYQRKFNLSDLDKIFIASGYRINNISIDAGYMQFGKADYYIEQSFKLALSYRYRYFIISLLTSNKHLNITTAQENISLNALSFGISAGVHYKRFHLSFVNNNLNQPRFETDAERLPSQTDIYAEIESQHNFSVVGHIRFEKHQKTMLSIGQYFNLMTKHGLFWAVQTNPISYGGGLEINRSNLSLIYSVLYHPVLGLTHNLSLSYFIGSKKEKK